LRTKEVGCFEETRKEWIRFYKSSKLCKSPGKDTLIVARENRLKLAEPEAETVKAPLKCLFLDKSSIEVSMPGQKLHSTVPT
jgi:hypothetical protein